MAADADQDEVVFEEDGRLRVLRGTIVSEDENFINLQRRDGDWSIRKSLVHKVQRARRRV
jgi:hypothetical protein